MHTRKVENRQQQGRSGQTDGPQIYEYNWFWPPNIESYLRCPNLCPWSPLAEWRLEQQLEQQQQQNFRAFAVPLWPYAQRQCSPARLQVASNRADQARLAARRINMGTTGLSATEHRIFALLELVAHVLGARRSPCQACYTWLAYVPFV
eukprot:scaffold62605_cov23-Prasinocladus_malaysianus.AAC.1